MTARIGLALSLFLFASSTLAGGDKVALREEFRPGETAVVSLNYKAKGDLLDSHGNNKPLVHTMTAQGQIVFEEKTIAPDDDPSGSPRRSLRYYSKSAIESVVDDRRTVLDLRQPVRLVVCELRKGKPFLFSPGGPLTSDEYSLLEADAALDSLVVGELLPTEPVAVGESWKPSDAAVAAVFNLSQVSKNEVVAKLEKLEAASARVTLTGKLAGVASGAKSQQTISGHFIFDRTRSRVASLDLTITEERSPSPIAWGISSQAGFVLKRKFDEPTPKLSDPEIEKLPLTAHAAIEHLAYVQPDGAFRFHFPRGWHVSQSTPKAAALTLMENGQFISECHVLAAPTVAAGTHMSTDEFRAQVQQALGKQFGSFIQEGEVPAPKGYWIYRLAAAGANGDKPVVWYYHLAAGPQGNQVVFIFRLHPDQIDRFGATDLSVVSSVEFGTPRTATNK